MRHLDTHAKIATVTSADYRILIRGSLNFGRGSRFEQFDLSEGCAGYDGIVAIEGSLPCV